MAGALVLLAGAEARAEAAAAPHGSRAWPETPSSDAPLASTSRAARLEAIARLGSGEPARARVELRSLLDTVDPVVRREAARALAGLGEMAPVRAAARALEAGDEPDAALEVLRAAPQLPPEGWAATARALMSPDAVRARAAAALFAEKAQPAPVPALLRALDADAAELRTAAAELAGAQRAEAAVPALLAHLNDNDAAVREAAAAALGSLRVASAGPALMRAFDSAERDGAAGAEVAATVAEGLGRIGYEPAVAALAGRAFGGTQAGDAGRSYRVALAQTKPGLGLLVGQLRGAYPELVEVLACAPGSIEPALVAALQPDADQQVAALAASVLALRRTTAAAEPLARLAVAPHGAAFAALDALAVVGGPAALPTLLQSSASPSSSFAARALEGLAAAGPTEVRAVGAARGAFERGANVEVRRAALPVAASPMVPGRAAVLRAGLRDPARAVRAQALAVIADAPEPGDAALLVEAAPSLADDAGRLARALADVVGLEDPPLLLDGLERANDPALALALAVGLEAALYQSPNGTAEKREHQRERIRRAALRLLNTPEGAPVGARLLAGDAIAATDLRGGLAAAPAVPDEDTCVALAPVLARADRNRLRVWRDDARASLATRAASAWALAEPLPPTSMDRAPAPVRANAATAAAAGPAATGRLWLRMMSSDGRAWARRWFVLSTAHGPLWVRTDERGELRLTSLPGAGPVQVTMP